MAFEGGKKKQLPSSVLEAEEEQTKPLGHFKISTLIFVAFKLLSINKNLYKERKQTKRTLL